MASSKKVFGLSESQIARRVKVIAKAAGLPDWEFFSGHSGRVGTAHGPERRAHPRDRAPGSLEAGRRHGRPLHPRRISRFGSAVLIAELGCWCVILRTCHSKARLLRLIRIVLGRAVRW